jgi:hypothetical protein
VNNAQPEEAMKYHWLWVVMGTLVLTGCLAAETVPDGPRRNWQGTVSNMFQGEMQLISWDESGSEKIQRATGTIQAVLTHSSGFGGGKLSGQLEGRIKDGLFEADFFGKAEVQDGAARFRGKFRGTFSETQGFGTYDLYPIEYQNVVQRFNGDWSVQVLD